MRFMVKVSWDIDAGNELTKGGSLGPTIESILEDLKPEAVYFGLINGNRSAYIVVNADDAAELPQIAEPWFLATRATVEVEPVMLPEDLERAGPAIGAAAERYG